MAPLLAFSFACVEPAGADNTIDGGLYKKKGAKKVTNKQPTKNLEDSVPVGKASPRAALLARARNAGWSTPDLNALEIVLVDVGSLSETERTRARCRLGQVFKARKSLVLTTLREAGATATELTAAGRAIDDISAAMCSGASAEAHERALGEIFVKVNDRLTAGTTLEGRDVTMDAFEDLMREMMEHCFKPEDAISFKDLAGLTDKQFDARLGKLAFGSCGGSPGSGGIAGLPDLPAGSDSSGYAQCVREAFREGVTSNAECQDIAGGDGDGDTDMPTEEELGVGGGEDRIAPQDQSADGDVDTPMDRHNRSSHDVGVSAVLIGGAFVAVAVGGGGLPAVAIGLVLIVYGLEQVDEASGNFIERNHRRASWSLWQCPTLSTPAGSFGFNDPSGGAQPNMTVMDVLRACRCENNPIDAFLPSSLGAFGGPSCELGSRLRCMRESGNDVATPPSPECAALLYADNKVSIAARYQDCSVVSCGDNGLLGEDCSCWGGGSGSPGGGTTQDPCATVRCPQGVQPVPNGMRCSCETTGPGGAPSVDCLPGAPGCGAIINPGGFPGGLPNGGKLPLPGPAPKPNFKPMPKPFGK